MSAPQPWPAWASSAIRRGSIWCSPASRTATPWCGRIALIAAAEIGDGRALGPLKRALEDERADVRFQAVASLAMLAPDHAVKPLSKRVDDDDPEVRAHLADALGSLERPEAALPLARLLEDGSPPVRRAAAVGLARIGDARGVPALIDALDDDERFFEAAWGLGELGAQEAVEPLAKIANAFLKPLAFKAAAAAALVRLGDRRGVEVLRGVLGALRSDARSYAVELIGELGLEELADDVVALAVRARGADPVVVARTLAKLADASPAARGALEAMARRGDEAGRTAKVLLGA